VKRGFVTDEIPLRERKNHVRGFLDSQNSIEKKEELVKKAQ
jgi:hypothetical protein